MIDGFKIRISDKTSIRKIRNSEHLDYRYGMYERSGFCDSFINAIYKSLYFEYNRDTDGCLFIRGSLPKYATGLSNYVNMSLCDALSAFEDFAKDFDIKLSDMEIVNLEWGLNVTLPEDIPVDRFLDNMLVYKGNKPKKREVYEGEGEMKVYDLTQQSLKFYNKSAQQKKHSNVLRYENLFKRSFFLRNIDIVTVEDLFFGSGRIKALNQLLLDKINHLVFYDYTIPMSSIPNRKKKLLLTYNNEIAWVRLLKEKPESYRKKRKAFRDSVSEICGRDYNELFYNLVKTEAEALHKGYVPIMVATTARKYVKRKSM